VVAEAARHQARFVAELLDDLGDARRRRIRDAVATVEDTFETVETDTPAADATYCMVTRRDWCMRTLGPTIRIWIFLSAIGSLQLFDLVWIMTLGGPANASDTTSVYMIDHGFRGRFGVIFPEAAFSLSINIVILRPFRRDIPGELEDAALVDGSTRLGFFWRILLPLSLPAISTVAILAFVISWNFLLLPLLVFNNQDHLTSPLGVAAFQTQCSEDTARVLAFSALSVLPTLVFFLAAERRIVGALGGAVKG
jgi:ABC-type maltose transport system permease subunit